MMDLDYRAYLKQKGFSDEEIPQDFTEEQKEELDKRILGETYQYYFQQAKAETPTLTKSQAEEYARNTMIEKYPETRRYFGLWDKPMSAKEATDISMLLPFMKDLGIDPSDPEFNPATFQLNANPTIESYVDKLAEAVLNKKTTKYNVPELADEEGKPISKDEFRRMFYRNTGLTNLDSVQTYLEYLRRASGEELDTQQERTPWGFVKSMLGIGQTGAIGQGGRSGVKLLGNTLSWMGMEVSQRSGVDEDNIGTWIGDKMQNLGQRWAVSGEQGMIENKYQRFFNKDISDYGALGKMGAFLEDSVTNWTSSVPQAAAALSLGLEGFITKGGAAAKGAKAANTLKSLNVLGTGLMLGSASLSIGDVVDDLRTHGLYDPADAGVYANYVGRVVAYDFMMTLALAGTISVGKGAIKKLRADRQKVIDEAKAAGASPAEIENMAARMNVANRWFSGLGSKEARGLLAKRIGTAARFGAVAGVAGVAEEGIPEGWQEQESMNLLAEATGARLPSGEHPDFLQGFGLVAKESAYNVLSALGQDTLARPFDITQGDLRLEGGVQIPERMRKDRYWRAFGSATLMGSGTYAAGVGSQALQKRWKQNSFENFMYERDEKGNIRTVTAAEAQARKTYNIHAAIAAQQGGIPVEGIEGVLGQMDDQGNYYASFENLTGKGKTPLEALFNLNQLANETAQSLDVSTIQETEDKKGHKIKLPNGEELVVTGENSRRELESLISIHKDVRNPIRIQSGAEINVSSKRKNKYKITMTIGGKKVTTKADRLVDPYALFNPDLHRGSVSGELFLQEEGRETQGISIPVSVGRYEGSKASMVESDVRSSLENNDDWKILNYSDSLPLGTEEKPTTGKVAPNKLRILHVPGRIIYTITLEHGKNNNNVHAIVEAEYLRTGNSKKGEKIRLAPNIAKQVLRDASDINNITNEIKLEAPVHGIETTQEEVAGKTVYGLSDASIQSLAKRVGGEIVAESKNSVTIRSQVFVRDQSGQLKRKRVEFTVNVDKDTGKTTAVVDGKQINIVGIGANPSMNLNAPANSVNLYSSALMGKRPIFDRVDSKGNLILRVTDDAFGGVQQITVDRNGVVQNVEYFLDENEYQNFIDHERERVKKAALEREAARARKLAGKKKKKTVVASKPEKTSEERQIKDAFKNLKDALVGLAKNNDLLKMRIRDMIKRIVKNTDNLEDIVKFFNAIGNPDTIQVIDDEIIIREDNGLLLTSLEKTNIKELKKLLSRTENINKLLDIDDMAYSIHERRNNDNTVNAVPFIIDYFAEQMGITQETQETQETLENIDNNRTENVTVTEQRDFTEDANAWIQAVQERLAAATTLNEVLAIFNDKHLQVSYRICSRTDIISRGTGNYNTYEEALKAAKNYYGEKGEVMVSLVLKDKNGKVLRDDKSVPLIAYVSLNSDGTFGRDLQPAPGIESTFDNFMNYLRSDAYLKYGLLSDPEYRSIIEEHFINLQEEKAERKKQTVTDARQANRRLSDKTARQRFGPGYVVRTAIRKVARTDAGEMIELFATKDGSWTNNRKDPDIFFTDEEAVTIFENFDPEQRRGAQLRGYAVLFDSEQSEIIGSSEVENEEGMNNLAQMARDPENADQIVSDEEVEQSDNPVSDNMESMTNGYADLIREVHGENFPLITRRVVVPGSRPNTYRELESISDEYGNEADVYVDAQYFRKTGFVVLADKSNQRRRGTITMELLLRAPITTALGLATGRLRIFATQREFIEAEGQEQLRNEILSYARAHIGRDNVSEDELWNWIEANRTSPEHRDSPISGVYQGEYDNDTGIASIVGDAIPWGYAAGVLHHEMGVHARKNMNAWQARQLDKLINEMNELRNQDSELGSAIRMAAKAHAGVLAKTLELKGQRAHDEELLCYFVADNFKEYDLAWRTAEFFRNLFRDTDTLRGDVKQMSIGDIVRIARGMAREVAKTTPSHNSSRGNRSMSMTTVRNAYGLTENTVRKQMREVERYYRQEENQHRYLMAKNSDGMFVPTNLTPTQWLFVRTPMFKRWFGDWELDPMHASAVLDENGEPMVLWHDTGNDYLMHDAPFLGSNTRLNFYDQMFLGDSMRDAEEHAREAVRRNAKGHSVGIFLNMRRPFRATDTGKLRGYAAIIGLEESPGLDLNALSDMETLPDAATTLIELFKSNRDANIQEFLDENTALVQMAAPAGMSTMSAHRFYEGLFKAHLRPLTSTLVARPPAGNISQEAVAVFRRHTDSVSNLLLELAHNEFGYFRDNWMRDTLNRYIEEGAYQYEALRDALDAAVMELRDPEMLTALVNNAMYELRQEEFERILGVPIPVREELPLFSARDLNTEQALKLRRIMEVDGYDGFIDNFDTSVFYPEQTKPANNEMLGDTVDHDPNTLLEESRMIAANRAYALSETDVRVLMSVDDALTQDAKRLRVPYEQLRGEYWGVYRAHRNHIGWMQDSNLDEYSWVMVRTPTFKRWYGDWQTAIDGHMILDENLEPVRMKPISKRVFVIGEENENTVFVIDPIVKNDGTFHVERNNQILSINNTKTVKKKNPEQHMFSYVPIEAAQRLDQFYGSTTRAENYEKALRAHAEGRSMVRIHYITGWQLIEGRWVYGFPNKLGEKVKIADSKSRIATRIYEERAILEKEIENTKGILKDILELKKNKSPNYSEEWRNFIDYYHNNLANELKFLTVDINDLGELINYASQLNIPTGVITRNFLFFPDVTLSQIYRDEALFAAYPEARDIEINIGNVKGTEEGFDGIFYHATKHIGLSMNFFTLPVEERHSLLIHEIQHWIDDREGYQGGTSFDNYIQNSNFDIQLIEDKLRKKFEEIKKHFDSNTLIRFEEMFNDGMYRFIGEQLRSEFSNSEEIGNLVDDYLVLLDTYMKPYYWYMSDISEIIARSAAKHIHGIDRYAPTIAEEFAKEFPNLKPHRSDDFSDSFLFSSVLPFADTGNKSFSRTDVSATENIGTFASSEDRFAYSMTGIIGAENLDRAEEATTRLDNLAVARDMEATDKDAKAIKFATGWERGRDGKWRYEIDDSGNRVSLDGDMDLERKQPGYRRYKELLEKYADRQMSLDERTEFDRLSEQFGAVLTQQMMKTRNARKGVSLHNVLEAPELFKAYPQLKNVRVKLDWKTPEGDGNYNNATKTITLGYGGSTNPLLSFTLHHEVQHAIQYIEGFARGGTPDQFSLTSYRRLAGETEARNVERRLNMTAEERRASLASETEDVAREDQIVLEQMFSQTELRQDITSADTSLVNNDPKLYKNKWFVQELRPGNENLDIGGGRTSRATERLGEHGVINRVFDPFNRAQENNAEIIREITEGKKYPTVTVSNVLNTIAEPDVRSNVILQTAKALSPEGKAFFTFYVAPKPGITKQGYQTAMKAQEYVPEIQRWYDTVERHGDIIIASNPRQEVQSTQAVWWDQDPREGGNTTYYSQAEAAPTIGEAIAETHYDANSAVDVENSRGAKLLRDGAIFIDPKEVGNNFARVRDYAVVRTAADELKQDDTIGVQLGLVREWERSADPVRRTILARAREMMKAAGQDETKLLAFTLRAMLERGVRSQITDDVTSPENVLARLSGAIKGVMMRATRNKRDDVHMTAERLLTTANAMLNLDNETVSEMLGLPEDAVLTEEQESIFAPRNEAPYMRLLMDDIANMLAQYDDMDATIVNGQPAIITPAGDAIVLGTNPLYARNVVERFIDSTNDHEIYEDGVVRNDTEDFDLSPLKQWINGLPRGSQLNSTATEDDVNHFMEVNIPKHIRDRIQVVYQEDEEAKRIFANNTLNGVFFPRSSSRKIIYIRAYNRNLGDVIGTIAHEVSHFGWAAWNNSDMEELIVSIYDALATNIQSTIPQYWNKFTKNGTQPFLSRQQKMILVNEYLAYFGTNLYELETFATTSGALSQDQEVMLKEAARLVREEITKIKTRMAKGFKEAYGRNPDHVNHYVETLLRMTMAPFHGRGVHLEYKLADTGMEGRLGLPGDNRTDIYDQIVVYTNDFGQIYEPTPISPEAQVNQTLMRKYAKLPRFWKAVALFAWRNFKVPGKAYGDTILGIRNTVLLQRAWKAIDKKNNVELRALNDDYGHFSTKLMELGIDPDEIGLGQGYVQTLQARNITDKELLEKAKLYDQFLQVANQRIFQNVIEIRSAIREHADRLEYWMRLQGAQEQTIADMKRKMENFTQRFVTDWEHRRYRAYTEDDLDNLSEMMRILTTDYTGLKNQKYFSDVAEAKQAELETLEQNFRRGRVSESIYAKQREELQRVVNNYQRLSALYEWVNQEYTAKYLKVNPQPGDVQDQRNEANRYREVNQGMRDVVQSCITKNEREDDRHILETRLSFISAMHERKLDENDAHDVLKMRFLDPVHDPVLVMLHSLDQQQKVLAKLAFNLEFGESLLQGGMAWMRGTRDHAAYGDTTLTWMETGSFLQYIVVDPFFADEIKNEQKIQERLRDQYFGGAVDLMKANKTVYNTRMAISNYLSNISVNFMTGHLMNVENWGKAWTLSRRKFMETVFFSIDKEIRKLVEQGQNVNVQQVASTIVRQHNEEIKKLDEEMESLRVWGGSISNSQVMMYARGTHEKAIGMVTEFMRLMGMKKTKKDAIDAFVAKYLTMGREFYGFGDEWGKPLTYLNNRAVMLAKYKALYNWSQYENPQNQLQRAEAEKIAKEIEEKAVKDAALLTMRETTTWELAPNMIRNLARKQVRFWMPDFLLHQFQMFRIMVSVNSRMKEAAEDLGKLRGKASLTSDEQLYMNLLKNEIVHRRVGFYGTMTAYAAMSYAATSVIPALTMFVTNFLNGGPSEDDLKRRARGKDEKNDGSSLSIEEWRGLSRICASKARVGDLFMPWPFGWVKGKEGREFYAINWHRVHAALTHAVPKMPTEQNGGFGTVGDWIRYIVENNLWSGEEGSIAVQMYNLTRGRDRHDKPVTFSEAMKIFSGMVLVPETLNTVYKNVLGTRAMFTEEGGLPWYQERKHHELSFADWGGTRVVRWHVDDFLESMGYRLKQLADNRENAVRRSLIFQLRNNPDLTDREIAGLVKDITDANNYEMQRLFFDLKTARDFLHVDPDRLRKRLTEARNGRKDIMSKDSAEWFLAGRDVLSLGLINTLKSEIKALNNLPGESNISDSQRKRTIANMEKTIQKLTDIVGQPDRIPKEERGTYRRWKRESEPTEAELEQMHEERDKARAAQRERVKQGVLKPGDFLIFAEDAQGKPGYYIDVEAPFDYGFKGTKKELEKHLERMGYTDGKAISDKEGDALMKDAGWRHHSIKKIRKET